jgi:hypothetical protein
MIALPHWCRAKKLNAPDLIDITIIVDECDWSLLENSANFKRILIRVRLTGIKMIDIIIDLK